MLPLWLAQVIVGCAVAVASQLRQLAQLSWVCYVGNIAQLTAACLLAASMLSDIDCHTERPAGMDGCGTPDPAGKHPDSQHAWLLGVVFAYGGQYAYVDIARQMRNRTAFTAVLHLSIGIMTVLYLLVGAMVYAARGPAAAELQVLAPNGPVLLSRTAVACVLVQTLVQLVIAVYIWTTTLVTWYLHRCNAVCSHAAFTTLGHQDTPKLHAVASDGSSIGSVCQPDGLACNRCRTCDSQRDIEGQRDLIPDSVCVDSVTGVDETQSEPPLVPRIPSQQQQQQQSQVDVSQTSSVSDIDKTSPTSIAKVFETC
jgi:hypothetical protein